MNLKRIVMMKFWWNNKDKNEDKFHKLQAFKLEASSGYLLKKLEAT